MRTLPSSAVTVLGKENITGVVCTFPPHLIKNDSGDAITKDKIWIDTGLPAEKVKSLVELGDRMSLRNCLITELPRRLWIIVQAVRLLLKQQDFLRIKNFLASFQSS